MLQYVWLNLHFCFRGLSILEQLRSQQPELLQKIRFHLRLRLDHHLADLDASHLGSSRIGLRLLLKETSRLWGEQRSTVQIICRCLLRHQKYSELLVTHLQLNHRFYIKNFNNKTFCRNITFWNKITVIWLHNISFTYSYMTFTLPISLIYKQFC